MTGASAFLGEDDKYLSMTWFGGLVGVDMGAAKPAVFEIPTRQTFGFWTSRTMALLKFNCPATGREVERNRFGCTKLRCPAESDYHVDLPTLR
jgi:hypothetical protein